MHRTAVWQHSSNLNIKIVHNSFEHFLWNSSDFSSDDSSLVCGLFSQTLSFRYSPPPHQKNSQVVWNVGNRMVRGYRFNMKWVYPMGSYAWGIQVFCSVRVMRHHLISRTEHLNTSGLTSNGTDTFRIKLITPSHPIPKISTHLTVFWGGTWKRVCENNSQTREDIIRKGIRRIPQEMLNRVVDNFIVRLAAALSYSSAVHGTNIVLITEKV